jgi:hypothetical protein
VEPALEVTRTATGTTVELISKSVPFPLPLADANSSV